MGLFIFVSQPGPGNDIPHHSGVLPTIPVDSAERVASPTNSETGTVVLSESESDQDHDNSVRPSTSSAALRKAASNHLEVIDPSGQIHLVKEEAELNQ